MPLTADRWLSVAAVNGAIAVAAGAFAAHGLKAHLAPAMLEVFKTGAQYQLAHALAIGLASFAGARLAALFFLIGILLFSGSLYALALSGITGLGIITPFGGVAFLAGWVCLAIAGWKRA